MNIEEAIEMLKRIYVTGFNTSSIYDNVPNVNLAIETLLTAYETLKDEDFSKKLSIDELLIDLEKEKEKNKKLEKDILFYKRIIDEQQETIKSYEEYFAEKYNISSRTTVWKEE